MRDEGIVPLINIVFLLLIFFLLAGTLAPSADIAVDYAETSERPAMQAPPDALYVSAAGYLSYQGRVVGLEDLAEAVANAPPAAARSPFPVVADRGLPARELGPILGELARAGLNRVRLVTQREGAR